MAVPSPFRLEVDPEQLRALVADLKELEGGRRMVTLLRRNLQKAAEPAVEQVKSNASWSSRIPDAVGTQVRFTAKKVGVSIFVNRKKAPHARALENDGQAGDFTHPLFGTNTQVQQSARPFFFDQLAGHMPAVESACGDAIDEAARAAGFR